MTRISCLLLCAFLYVLVSCEYKDVNNSFSNGNVEEKTKKAETNTLDFSKQIIGSWATDETASGEILAFDKNGTYSGCDGKSEFEGTWSLEGNLLTLSLGGTSEIRISEDTLFINDLVYYKEEL